MQPSRLRPIFWPMRGFLLNYFFLFASTAVFYPYFPLFIRARGFSHSQLGLLLSLFQVAGIVGPLVVGRLADRLCRYRLLLLLCVCASILCLVPMNFLSGLPAFLPFLLLIGMGFNSLIPLSDALAARELPDATHRYGQVRIAGSAGFIVASVVLQAARLIDGASSTSILVNFIVLSVLYAGAALFLPRCGAAPSESDRALEAGRSGRGFGRAFWFGLSVIFLGALSMTAVNSFLSVFIREGLGWRNVSALWAIAAVAEMPLFFFSGRLIERWGLRGTLLASLAAMIVRLLIYALAPVVWAVVAAQLLHSLSFGLFQATMVQFVARTVGRERIGQGMTIAATGGWGLASFVGSLAGGYVIEKLGFSALHLIYALPAGLGLTLLLTLGRAMGIPSLPRVARQTG